MSSAQRFLPVLVEALLACPHGPTRSRILLEAVLAAGGTQAASLWRKDPASDAAAERWFPVLERGPGESLPAPDLVRAVLAGELAPELPGRGLVLASRLGSQGAALVLGEADLDEEQSDLYEALLLFAELLDRPGERPPGALELLEAALPRPPRDDGETVRWLHDLKNLLTAIHARVEVWDERREALTDDLLERECRRAGELLLGVLDEGYRLRRDPARDPIAVLRDVCAAERERASAAGIALELEIDPQAAGWSTRLSEAMLERVARNLIVNAREALVRQRDREGSGQALRGGRINVRWSFQAGPPAQLLLSVLDDGPGLGPHEPVGGEHPTGWVELASSKGSGAGLPSVRELVESAGGSLRAANRPQGGAEFVVALVAQTARI